MELSVVLNNGNETRMIEKACRNFSFKGKSWERNWVNTGYYKDSFKPLGAYLNGA